MRRVLTSGVCTGCKLREGEGRRGRKNPFLGVAESKVKEKVLGQEERASKGWEKRKRKNGGTCAWKSRQRILGKSISPTGES